LPTTPPSPSATVAWSSWPTPSPSPSPTDVPSWLPTSSPSLSPTVAPSPYPLARSSTVSPSMYPSKSPSFQSEVSIASTKYCIERVKLHVLLIVVAVCLVITICVCCIYIINGRSDRSVLSPKIYSPSMVRIAVKSKPREMPTIAMKEIAIERMTPRGTDDIPDGEVI